MAIAPNAAAIRRGLPHRVGDRAVQANFEALLRLVGQSAAAGGLVVVDGWFETTTAASQTGNVIPRWETNGPAIYPVFFDCYVSFFGVYALGGPSAGSATVFLYRNGSIETALAPQITAAGAVLAENTNPAVLALASGDTLGVRYDSDASWQPTNTQLLAVIGLTPT